MRAEGFELKDETVFDKSIIERDLSKIYHEREVIINDSRKSIDFIVGGNSNYYQTSHAYLQFETFFQRKGGHFEDDDTDMIILVKNASETFLKKLP